MKSALLWMMGAHIILLILCIIIPTISAVANDSAILKSIKGSWQETPPTWDDTDPCSGSWDGITCTNGRVIRLTLASMQLKGDLHGDIWQLTELHSLDLSYNKGLSGSLPPQVENLRKLTELSLVGCSFTGTIPDTIGRLENLQTLSLNSNNFMGWIPASIGNLRNLYWLDLTANKLTGTIPVSNDDTPGLDMLTNARHFHLGDNQLSGDIPPGLFNSNMKLIHLQLENNNLTGTIPSTLGLVTSLKVVRLERNFLSGNVPLNINNLTNASRIFMSHNSLTGPIPNFTGMNVLNTIDLSHNPFERSVAPSWFSTLSDLATIIMNNTNLEGELPAALFDIPQLQIVDLSYNWINGTLDISSNHSIQLQLVDLRNNQITESRQQKQYEEAIDLRLANNPICRESGGTDRFCLTKKGIIPYETPWNNCEPSSCDSDMVASPNCRCAYPYTGSITFKFPSFSLLGNSKLYDSLHYSLMNFFTKVSLPVDSVSLKNPRRSVEDYLVIDLEVFPYGAPRFNSTAIHGIGIALITNQTFHPPEAFNIYFFTPDPYNFFPDKYKSSAHTIVIVGSTLGGCLLVMLLVLTGWYIFHKKKQAQRALKQRQPFALWDPTSGSGGVPQLKGARSFSLRELEKYTSNFSEINNIGRGGYGMVYKGSLPNGQLIAIKRSKRGSSQGGLEFKNEIELLSRVHHKNLVGLIGFCFDQGEQMLIYEYVVNGTLKDSLSGRSGIRLDWMRRLKIALGAARGLQYLHDHADPPIIHRDVKTNNILLDERLVAKVADFGLSKLNDIDRTHVTTQVKGTMGYMDPEYYMTQQLTDKSDTYSFGVVMLELITARNPIQKGKYIVREVKESMNKNKDLYDLQDVLDPTMGLSSQLKGVERFVDLALRCVEDTGNQRPTMSEVVKEMESIMELVGLNPCTESLSSASTSYSTSYEGKSKDHDYTYSDDSLIPPILHPK